MRTRGRWHFVITIVLGILAFFGSGPDRAMAETLRSSKYQATETQFGSTSALEGCSDQYCATASIGDMAIGVGTNGTTSAAFGAIAAASDPFLEVIVDPGISNLGTLTTEHTATKTTTVRVRNYLSDGYTMQISGVPPRYGTHTLSAPAAPSASSPGTEQFAINAAANTLPSVGAAPSQLPSDQISFGMVEDGYGTPNRFKYVSGDIVARSLSESGRTDYTISMIVNVADSTPAGHYIGDFSAVVIPIF